MVSLFKTLGGKAWSKLMNYGKRWSVETVFSTFKRILENATWQNNAEHSKRANCQSPHIQHGNKHLKPNGEKNP